MCGWIFLFRTLRTLRRVSILRKHSPSMPLAILAPFAMQILYQTSFWIQNFDLLIKEIIYSRESLKGIRNNYWCIYWEARVHVIYRRENGKYINCTLVHLLGKLYYSSICCWTSNFSAPLIFFFFLLLMNTDVNVSQSSCSSILILTTPKGPALVRHLWINWCS